jgi:threonine dehydrogenase-like Zn-dependent dehydrogenase
LQNPSAVLYGPRDVRIEDRPVPLPEAGQVLVEIAAVGICGSDVHYFEHGRIGDYVVSAPMIIGHVSAGTVVSVGLGVDPARVGQLVALEPGVPWVPAGSAGAVRTTSVRTWSSSPPHRWTARSAVTSRSRPTLRTPSPPE